jgi:hypothetical protein
MFRELTNSTISSSSSEIIPVDKTDYWINVHGILMSIAWCFFIPLGVIVARNKWLFKDNTFFDLHVWFHSHRILQLIGTGLFLSSFILAMTGLDVPDGNTGRAHYNIGMTIMAGVSAQSVIVLFRPPKKHNLRLIWNFFHHNVGRVTLILAFVNLYTGIYCMQSQTGYSYYITVWLLPISILIFTFSEIFIILEIINYIKRNKKNNIDNAETALIENI